MLTLLIKDHCCYAVNILIIMFLKRCVKTEEVVEKSLKDRGLIVMLPGHMNSQYAVYDSV